jgi:hypothetical protein
MLEGLPSELALIQATFSSPGEAPLE